MTQQERDLLSQDICERLPYGVKIETEYHRKATLVDIRKNISYGACKDLLVTYDISGEETPYQSEERSSTISKIKPYLFPLSNMSEDLINELYTNLTELELKALNDEIEYSAVSAFEIDFYHKHHIDYCGLIPMGLANDATGLNIY